MYGRNTHAITLEDIRQRIKPINNAVAKYFLMTCVIGLTLYCKLYQPVAKGRKPSHFFLFVLLQKQFLLYGLNVFYAVINRCIQEKVCPPERLLQVYKMNKNFDVTFSKLPKS